MISFLADTSISGEWLTGFVVAVIGAVFTGLAHVRGKKKGLQEATNNITIQSPVPEVPVKRVYSPPTFSQHMAIVERVGKLEDKTEDLSKEIQAVSKEVQDVGTEIRRESAKQYVDILTAGHERETRITDKLDGIARAFHGRVDDLLKANLPTKS